MVVRPARPAVTSPEDPTDATPGSPVAQRTMPGTGAPAASRIVARKVTVSPVARVSFAGVTAMVTLPSVARSGTSPASGVSRSDTDAFAPGRTLTVVAPAWVSMPLASYARK